MFIITGGGSGLGRALARNLASRNKAVLIVGRREQLLQETASASPLIKYLCADVSTAEGLNLITQHVAGVPHITGLINNAGTLNPITSMQKITPDAWQQAINTNVNTALFLPQKLCEQLNNGRVLNISSGAAYFAIKGWAAYCVTKAALSMLTKCWQLESEHLAFASVMPGIVDTDMQATAREGVNMDKEQTDFYRTLKHRKQLISADTVAQFLTWLLLDIDKEHYQSQEWDIYDSSHHEHWLRAPHQVIHWEH